MVASASDHLAAGRRVMAAPATSVTNAPVAAGAAPPSAAAWLRRMLVVFPFALGVAAALIIYADLGAYLDSLAAFDWYLAPAIVGLVLGSYGLRFLKWHLYLGLIGARQGLPLRSSGLIFASGLAMTITPAKSGEWLKSYLLNRANGTPASRSIPVIFCERLTDAAALLLLSLVGVAIHAPSYWPLFAVAASLALLSIAFVRVRLLANWSVRRAQSLPLVGRLGGYVRESQATSYELLALGPTMRALGIALLAWTLEAIAWSLVLYGLTGIGGFEAVVKVALIMGVSLFAGTLSFVPGGLGVSETGIIALEQVLFEIGRAAAAASAVLIRFFTLWLGVVLGIVALIIVLRDRRFRTDQSASAGT
ncbi:MAG: hypothetical protein GEU28_09660 [Dehalococcoidia bacterium]|nr:hypothetical protein [Dehalococcoidia bacterium]